MSATGDKFRDSIAFARCVLRDDWDGIESLLLLNPDPLDLLIPQSWILNAAIAKMASQLDLSVDEVWGVMLQSVETVGEQIDGEEDGNSAD